MLASWSASIAAQGRGVSSAISVSSEELFRSNILFANTEIPGDTVVGARCMR
jgi:hypothetical protein